MHLNDLPVKITDSDSVFDTRRNSMPTTALAQNREFRIAGGLRNHDSV